MKSKKNTSPAFVVRDTAIDRHRSADAIGNLNNQPNECTVIESMRKLMALGLSAREIEDLDMRQPAIQAITEYARLEDRSRTDAGLSVGNVDTTLKAIEGQMQDLDLEIEMLNLRTRALKRRTHILEKLARALESEDDNLLAT